MQADSARLVFWRSAKTQKVKGSKSPGELTYSMEAAGAQCDRLSDVAVDLLRRETIERGVKRAASTSMSRRDYLE